MKTYNPHQTIAAISTPPGKGGVALIRVSGEGAVAVVAPLVRLRSGLPLADLPDRRVAYADFLDGDRPIDDVLVTVFRAPHSYTGEDTVEISCHGGLLLTRTLLTLLYENGAAPAAPGEFTRRAVLSGRLSLTEAEAVGAVLEAESRAQLYLASSPSRTRLSAALADIREGILTLMSTLWAQIDYPDEDLGELSRSEIEESLAALCEKAERLLATYRTGRAVNEGISAVLCGAPNVGKSSLYNLLAGEDLAIVTQHAGTTRDVLSTPVSLGRVLLRLQDTAGLRETADPVEELGVARSRHRIEAAELLLCVFDGTRVLQNEDLDLLKAVAATEKCAIAILNKCDEPTVADEAAIRAACPHTVRMSAKTGEGREALCALIDRLFTDERISLGEDAVLATARQNAACTAIERALVAALAAHRAGYPADVVSSDVERALAALSELDGRTVSEQIVDEIFSRFCVGK